MVAYVAEDKQAKVNAAEWMADCVACCGGTMIKGDIAYAIGEAPADPENGMFPIKMKDTALAKAIAYLKDRGCFPDLPDDSDDDPAFGDDAFDDIDNM
jgi:hypothetical protein